MPLPKYMEEQLAGAPAEYRDAIAKAWDANPDVAAKLNTGIDSGVMRQSDFDRKHNALKEKTSEWQKWHDDNQPIYKEAIAKAQELETELKVLKGQSEASGTPPAEQSKIIEKMGELANKLELLEKKFVTEDQVRKIQQDGLTWGFSEVLQLGSIEKRFSRDFGKELSEADRDTFLKFASVNKIEKLGDAYEKYWAKDLKEKEHADWEKDYISKHKSPGSLPLSGDPAPMGIVQAQAEGVKLHPTLTEADSLNTWKQAAVAALAAEGKG